MLLRVRTKQCLKIHTSFAVSTTLLAFKSRILAPTVDVSDSKQGTSGPVMESFAIVG